MAGPNAFAGRHVLIVEDDFFVADDLVASLEELGARVVGPVASVRGALDLIGKGQRLDGAVLDINLQGEMAFPVADALTERAVSFVFTTGYDRSIIPARFAGVVACEKPFNTEQLARAMWG